MPFILTGCHNARPLLQTSMGVDRPMIVLSAVTHGGKQDHIADSLNRYIRRALHAMHWPITHESTPWTWKLTVVVYPIHQPLALGYQARTQAHLCGLKAICTLHPPTNQKKSAYSWVVRSVTMASVSQALYARATSDQALRDASMQDLAQNLCHDLMLYAYSGLVKAAEPLKNQ